ncbi:MAG: hypothetical protein ABL999_18790 [Pyrinomonadaceae bacterium]
MGQFILKDCSFTGGEGSTAIRVRGDGFNFNITGTQIDTTHGIDVQSTEYRVNELMILLRSNDIHKDDFTDLIEKVQHHPSAERDKIVSESPIFKKLSVVADVAGLSQVVVAIAMSPQCHELVKSIFS